eukprot:gb/GECG01012932.1/.p1 GENE.gb/GECG01012932.1/~~gb/GECG01012932.1/.p1  ORF type:complete len:129 (+),score=13.64 gb/GECG01012932.1/:1-387(+)
MRASKIVAYLCWFPLGIFGLHRFYVGRWRSGLIWMLTGGLLLVGWLRDFVLIPTFVEEYNQLTLRKNLLDSQLVTRFATEHVTPLQGFDYSGTDGTAFYAPPILDVDAGAEGEQEENECTTEHEPQPA